MATGRAKGSGVMNMLRRLSLTLALAGGLIATTAGLSFATAPAPTETRSLAQLLQSDAPADVAIALRALDGVPTPGLEDALVVAAQRAETELASAALDLLAQTGDVRAVALLEDAIRSTDPASVSVASVWLSSYGFLGLEVAERLLEDPDRVVRHAVLRALTWFEPSPEVESLLERTIADSDHKTARFATAVLTRGR